jgi:hypothetical protein
MIHLRPVRETIEKAKLQTTQRLRDEIEDEKISRDLVGKHHRRVQASARYKQTGETA